jgi:hypothetical protein
MAVKILFGVRPAELSFDELDQRIAECCACEAADVIAGRFIPYRSFEEDDENCRQVYRLVFQAMKHYATHEAQHGPVCRNELRQEKICRERMKKRRADIPF